MLSPHWVRLLLVILLGISAGRPAEGSEQMVTGVNAVASMYDTRTSLDEDEGKGCYTTGCLPRYTLDGLLNDEAESRWSCSEEIDLTIGECYITFDLHDSYTLSKIRIYFHKSEDLDRETNPFSVSTSVDNSTYSYSFGDVNTPGVALEAGENFSFPDGSIGQYVRLTAILDSDQWLSINEVETFVTVNVGAPSPTPSNNISGLTSTTLESAAPTLTYSLMPTSTASPTTLDTQTGELGCTTVTVDNTEGLDGVYEWDSIGTFLSTDISNATIESSQTSAECADTGSASCSVTEWTISSGANPLEYMAFDDAENPALITQVWLRVNCTGEEECVSSPANVVIACEEGSTSSAPLFTPSPTPAPVTSTDCDIVEVEGTSGGDLDGFYYDDGSTKQGGVTQFIGYDDDLTRNGNSLAAEWVTGGCPTPSGNTTVINGDCTWREWSITPDSDNVEAFEHFTYDEADHPVDIASGVLWYIVGVATTEPYGGDITINCAPTDTPALMTPSPSPAPTNTSTSVISPSLSPVTQEAVKNGSGSDGAPDNTPAIIGGVVGAAVVFGVLGFLWHKRSNTPLPLLRDPPSYDDIMGGAGSGSALKSTAGKG